MIILMKTPIITSFLRYPFVSINIYVCAYSLCVLEQIFITWLVLFFFGYFSVEFSREFDQVNTFDVVKEKMLIN